MAARDLYSRLVTRLRVNTVLNGLETGFSSLPTHRSRTGKKIMAVALTAGLAELRDIERLRTWRNIDVGGVIDCFLV